MLIDLLAIGSSGFNPQNSFLKPLNQHELSIFWGGQFAPVYPGQFAPESGGQFQPGKVVSLLRNRWSDYSVFSRQGWDAVNETSIELIFQGVPQKVNELRKHFSRMSGDGSLLRESTWRDGSFISTKIKRKATTMTFPLPFRQTQQIQLYDPPFKIRTDIVLSDDQLRAAKHSLRPAVIIGPAGCGKSVVISERIINTIKVHRGAGHIKILLTTFNKELLKKLAEWLLILLDYNKYQTDYIKDKDYQGYPNGSSTISDKYGEFEIRLVHFDMLPKYVGYIPLAYFNQTQHESILRKYINEIVAEKNVSLTEHADILNTDFLFEEYHRVIYGLQCRINLGLEAYQNVSRKGRGGRPTLRRGVRRELVWMVLSRYAKEIYTLGIQSFTTRRQLLLHAIQKGTINTKYDYVFVDEFQDCTNADFEIFAGLLKKVDRLIIAGDLAQAIHIGRSATIPKSSEMSYFERFLLKGSYRLPQRISECILELSRKIKEQSTTDVEEITPYKGSPPGARPIIIFGANLKESALKIAAVVKSYKIYGIDKVTILEKDRHLCGELVALGVEAETDTILKLKGLEKGCVIWATGRVVEFEKEVKEFVYTILTRTSCMLIILFDDSINESFQEIFSLLNRDRLIFWDEISESKFGSKVRTYVDRYSEDEES